MSGGVRFVVACVCVFLGVLPQVHADKKSTKRSSSSSEIKPEAKLEAHAESQSACQSPFLSEDVAGGYSAVLESHPLDALLAQDPGNLAVMHPSILMDSAQKYSALIRRFPPRVVLEPTYRTKRVQFYPIFSSGVLESNESMVVGQYDAIEATARYIFNYQPGKILLLRGGPGTGKTELLYVLNRVRSRLATTDPDFFEYTFRWVGLDGIPTLAHKAQADGTYAPAFRRSPLTLLPSGVQKKILAYVSEAFTAKFGMAPRPFLEPDPESKSMLTWLVKHYSKGRKQMSEADIVDILRKHVEIVRRVYDEGAYPGLIGYQGKHPKMHLLFVDEDLRSSLYFPKNDPLSFAWSGKVIQADGMGIFFDELHRNAPELRDSLLELAQNRRVHPEGVESVELDTIPFGASNDYSIEEATGNNPYDASIDRSTPINMRSPIHPMEVGKVVLYQLVKGGQIDIFTRKLEESTVERGSLSQIYLDPDASGKLEGPDGRVAVMIGAGANREKILLAPHALELITYTTAATRFVIDPKKLSEIAGELDVLPKSGREFFLNPVSRLKLILGQLQAENAIRIELARLRERLKEGEQGITARRVQDWFMRCLALAEANHRTLTPAIVDLAFQELMDSQGFDAGTNAIRAQWILVHKAIKTDLILPAIARDVTAISSGDLNRAFKMYVEVRNELIELGFNPDATHYNHSASERLAINFPRLRQLKEVYKRLHARELEPALIQNFHIRHTESEAMDPMLLAAIERFLLDTTLSTETVTGLYDSLTGRGGTNREMDELASQALSSLDRMGYDRTSFLEALSFIRDHQRENAPPKK